MSALVLVDLTDGDHISMVIKVECTFSPQFGESRKLVEHGDESYGLVDSNNKPI